MSECMITSVPSYMILSFTVGFLQLKRSVGSVEIGVGEKLIHLQLLYFQLMVFIFTSFRGRTKALKCCAIRKKVKGLLLPH